MRTYQVDLKMLFEKSLPSKGIVALIAFKPFLLEINRNSQHERIGTSVWRVKK